MTKSLISRLIIKIPKWYDFRDEFDLILQCNRRLQKLNKIMVFK